MKPVPVSPEPAGSLAEGSTRCGARERQPAGASLEYTALLRQALPNLLEKYRVGLLLDAGCGRFSWMGHTELRDVHYIGLDKAPELVAANQEAHGGRHRRFLPGDVTSDILPPADMMICREFLNSLSYAEIYEFFLNTLRSKIPLLLLTSHRIWHNRDSSAGRWRQLNLTRPPFSLPAPFEILEDWKEGHPSRYIGLWSQEQIREALAVAEHDFGANTRANLPSLNFAPPRPFHVAPPIAAEDIAARQVDLVTVFYGPEISLLQLQARSLAQNLDPKGIGKIHVIINEPEPAALFENIMEFADAEYGPLRDRLRVWTAAELSSADSSRGWRTQQTLKLRIADRVESPKYVTLDAKNHMIQSGTIDSFLAADGRPRSFWTVQAGSLKNYLLNSLKYFGLDQSLTATKVMPATTPYVLYTNAVRQMIIMVEAAEQVPFETFFHARGRDVTEFFLYFSYLRHQKEDLDKLYRFGGRFAVTLFTRWPDTAEQQAAALARLSDPKIIFFGLHKNRVAALDNPSRVLVRKAWIDAGIFPDDVAAQAFYEKILKDVGGSSP